MNESTISNMRSRNVSPRAEDAVKIAQALNTTVEYLVTGTETNSYKAELEDLKQKLVELSKK